MLTRLGIAVFWLTILAIQGLAQQQSGFTPGTSAPNPPTTAAPPNTPAHREDYDPLLDLPPLPRNTVTLIGGTVKSLDEVMNRMVIQPFGGKQKVRIAFDSRTRFFRDGKPITLRDVQQAQRVYVDTMLNGSKVFAKTIWIQTSVESGLSRGQIIGLDLPKSTVTIRDELSQQPLKLHIAQATVIRKDSKPATVNDLREGALVSLNFTPQREISELNLLATPGSVFSFAGRITYLDLSRKLIAIANNSDGKNYDVYMDAIAQSILRQLREGENVSVSAVFDGTRYAARQIDFAGSTSSSQQQPQ